MTDRDLSKLLALVLRHHPERAGVTLDPAGWVAVDALLAGLDRPGVDRAQLERVVAENDKQRYELDGDRIRARQGHTVQVVLGYVAAEPPEHLFHGTVAAAVPAIRREGLRRMDRHAVHLSPDRATAARVGGRRGRPVILRVRARELHTGGGVFTVTPNGVWLVDEVPAAFIDVEDER